MLIDYSLYLVTGRDLLPEGTTYIKSLEESLRGGVTVVQVREKNADTREFLEIALQSKALCDKYHVPLIINDRVDIALAVNADGVHLGQMDMPVHIARSLLPPNTIIGVSCNNLEHVQQAIKDHVDYIGIGAVWPTSTKQLSNPVVGVRGVGPLLAALDGTEVKAVAIGGIRSDNLLRTLHGSISPSGHKLDGIAVVSEIVASRDPYETSRTLRETYAAWYTFIAEQQAKPSIVYTADNVKTGVANLMGVIRATTPLIHQITNVVVTNQSANATLALGASPIMATAPEEMEDLSRVFGALLINFGTVTDKEGMILAGKYANRERKPLVFDPVGVGATQFRRKTAAQLLNSWQASVIKGNAGELGALAESKEVQAKGVDSVGSGFADSAKFVKDLAQRERCVVALTGKTDWVSDGTTVVRLDNGHELLGDITGSGCMVGTCITTFCAAAWAEASTENSLGMLTKGDMLLGAVGGILALTIAAEAAAYRSDVKGSGTFLPALIDELHNLKPETVIEKARIQVFS
ncbi:Hydroxyethylthiazole kinase family-domain-containing protein [Pisolithus marmoratus]|nr:Hydroxyethylthiazole kinase family-domain-containing protein [Pisolithus marmoratus]